MAVAHLPWTTDYLKPSKRRSLYLFLDYEPEVKLSHRVSGYVLDNIKKNCYTAVTDEKTICS